MKSLWRNLLVVAAAFSSGMAAYQALGSSPAAAAPAASGAVKWNQPGASAPDLKQADATWDERAPWGAPPQPVAPPPPPVPVPVGIIKVARGHEAIFMIAGAGELRLRPGGRLPDGGRLLRISGLRVTWVDGAGQQHQREMFGDPLQPPAAPGAR